MLQIDHVVYGVRDLEAAALRFREEHGLGSAPGGRHPGWGTANRIVPLGDEYVELVAVVDAAEARESVFGRWVLDSTAAGDRPLALCLAASDIDAVAHRLGLIVTRGSRTLPDGRELAWRGAGVEHLLGQPDLPFFFIAWDGPEGLHPGRTAVRHRSRARGIAWIEVGGAPERVRAWVGDDVPVRVAEGAPGIHAVALTTPEGSMILR